MLSIVERAAGFGDEPAVEDADGSHSYADLLEVSLSMARVLLRGRGDLEEARVAFMIPPSFEHVAWQWAIWRAGGIAVPIPLTHPPAEIEHLLDDARPELVVAGDGYRDTLDPLLAERFLPLVDVRARGDRPAVTPDVGPRRRAMMLYTSGTTGSPKGVVTTHAAIEAQIRSLVEAWEWSALDRILLVLPLHHIHGIVNVVGCTLWSGALCEIFPRFDPSQTWKRIGEGKLTLFMAVPTIYHRLITSWEGASPSERQQLSAGCRSLRLMVSGSAALPVPVLERWKEISGHTLLERYGMTEIGMALSNPLHGERGPGSVGSPLPNVEVRLVDEAGRPVPDGVPGEIQVRGPTLFSEYWERPDATDEAFVDGWFRTGDVASRLGDVYRILGRESVDIIKSGGEKLSALEIEEVLLAHHAVAEAAVVGVADEEWGQRVLAAVVARSPVDGNQLEGWCRSLLAPHKVPKAFHFVESLPRNAMGKVSKPELVALLMGK